MGNCAVAQTSALTFPPACQRPGNPPRGSHPYCRGRHRHWRGSFCACRLVWIRRGCVGWPARQLRQHRSGWGERCTAAVGGPPAHYQTSAHTAALLCTAWLRLQVELRLARPSISTSRRPTRLDNRSRSISRGSEPTLPVWSQSALPVPPSLSRGTGRPSCATPPSPCRRGSDLRLVARQCCFGAGWGSRSMDQRSC